VREAARVRRQTSASAACTSLPTALAKLNAALRNLLILQRSASLVTLNAKDALEKVLLDAKPVSMSNMRDSALMRARQTCMWERAKFASAAMRNVREDVQGQERRFATLASTFL
jgi:hypothetical protein